MDKKDLLKKAVKKEVAAVEAKEEKDEKKEEMDGEGGPFTDAVKKGYKNIKTGIDKTKTKVKDSIRKGLVKFVGDTPAGAELKKGLDKQGLKY